MSFIKLDKKIVDWGWFTDGNMLKVWLYLLVNAQYKPTEFKGIKLERGQILIGRKKLAEKLGMTEQSVRTCINRLKSTNEITIKSTNKYSLITIVKYAFYQDGGDIINQQINQQTNQQLTNNQPTTNHSKRNKEYKNIRNIYNTLPEYDYENNVSLSAEEEIELLKLMGKETDVH